nr:phage-related protein tail component-like protein [uncultured Mediterranean phage uvMED]
MTDKKIIRGSGGPPPTPPAPYRAPDTLNSRQFATILDLLSEGEIEGFATPSKLGLTKGTTAYTNASLKDIFLNDTPILLESASTSSPAASDFNFQSVTLNTKFGTNNQTKIAGIVGSDAAVSGFNAQDCTVAGGGVTQSLSTGKDAVKVTIMFPQLQKAEDNGDLLGSTVDLKIGLQINNQSSPTHPTVVTDTITGRTADPYSKEYRINLPAGYSQASIRVERVTADNTASDTIKDLFRVTIIQEIVDDSNTYPDSAYTSLRLDSEQFSSIPKRAFRIRGIKVRIPAPNNGLTPTVDLATGRIDYPENYVFNGTFGAAQWTSCPSCILLDLLTNERYGFGTFLDPDNTFTSSGTSTSLDLYSFVTASRYANTLVNDGEGGLEARFSTNVNIQSSKEAYDLIKDLASIMRCIPIWSQGSIALVQDSPRDSSYLFNISNVTPEGFNYTGSSLKQRHSVVSVSYFNMDSRELDFEVYGDGNTNAEVTRRAKFGIVYKQVKSFGCTSRGQAQRMARAIVFSEEQEAEVVNFATSIDAGAVVRPGSVITINDPVRSLFRRSGRIQAATTTSITVDDTQDLGSFSVPTGQCSVIMPDGSVEKKGVLSVVQNVITLESALSATPNVNSVWFLESDILKGQTFKVITVEEQDGINYVISALSYREEKYDNIESNEFATLPVRRVSRLNELRPAPQIHFPIREKVAVINNVSVNKILLSWTPVTGVTQYQVQYRFSNSNWVTEVVFRPDIEILNTQAGIYEFKVFSYNSALRISAVPSTAEYDATGKKDPPADVQNLTAEPVNNNLTRLRWDKSVDADVLHGGRVYIRHSNKTDGTGSFANSVDLIEAVAGNSTDVIVPSLEGEYILKFRDDGGRFSLGETSVIIDMPDIIDTQAIFTDREDTGGSPFGGTKTNTTLASGALKLTDPATNATGEYAFASILDLGGVFSLNLKRHFQSIGFFIGTNIEDLIPNTSPEFGGPADGGFDNYAIDNNFDGAAAQKTNAQILVATTTSAPASSSYQDSDFSGKPFNVFANGNFKGRGFKFKLKLSSDDTAQNISVEQAGYSASFDARTEQSSGVIASGTAAKAVTFGKPFFTGTSSTDGGLNAYLPSVGITIQNAVAGDFFTITSLSGSGFTVNIKNSGETANNGYVNRNFSYQAVGYGKGV